MNAIWWLQLLVHPVKALDLVDNHGKPDHGKILPAITLLVFLVLTVLERLPDLDVVLTLMIASHGYAGLRTLLRAAPWRKGTLDGPPE